MFQPSSYQRAASRALIADNAHTREIVRYLPEEHPLAMQLLGADPDVLAEAAGRLEAAGADAIDLNMGCPVAKIVAKGHGAALMRDSWRAAVVFRAMRKAITSKNADGYHGWQEAGPFDKIAVTCGIDHVPPPLLQQLATGGIMVIPVGPPGAQRLLKIIKEEAADSTIKVARSDIYGGRIVPFVPFTKLDGNVIKGTHNQR